MLFPNKIDSHPIFLNEPQKQQCNGSFYGGQFQLQPIYKSWQVLSLEKRGLV